MSIKQVLADATLATLAVADTESAAWSNRPRPNTRPWLVTRGDVAGMDNREAADLHMHSAIPLIGVGFDVLTSLAYLGDGVHSTRAQLGKFLGLAVNAGG
ncbi:MAG TPA: hypothetical protein VLC93_16260, partial [Myxococcota bacterium]|nr:hypothetical protein [Myxococcota bacterium]